MALEKACDDGAATAHFRAIVGEWRKLRVLLHTYIHSLHTYARPEQCDHGRGSRSACRDESTASTVSPLKATRRWRIHATCVQTSTATGRVTVVSPHLQTIPKPYELETVEFFTDASLADELGCAVPAIDTSTLQGALVHVAEEPWQPPRRYGHIGALVSSAAHDNASKGCSPMDWVDVRLWSATRQVVLATFRANLNKLEFLGSGLFSALRRISTNPPKTNL